MLAETEVQLATKIDTVEVLKMYTLEPNFQTQSKKIFNQFTGSEKPVDEAKHCEATCTTLQSSQCLEFPIPTQIGIKTVAIRGKYMGRDETLHLSVQNIIPLAQPVITVLKYSTSSLLLYLALRQSLSKLENTSSK